MTVNELKEKLENYPPDWEVIVVEEVEGGWPREPHLVYHVPSLHMAKIVGRPVVVLE